MAQSVGKQHAQPRLPEIAPSSVRKFREARPSGGEPFHISAHLNSPGRLSRPDFDQAFFVFLRGCAPYIVPARDPRAPLLPKGAKQNQAGGRIMPGSVGKQHAHTTMCPK